MKEIKFSHEYNKFFGIPSGSKVKLLQIFNIHYKELSTEFINYDTTTVKGSKYELPKTELIILLFHSHDTNTIFTTIRRWTQGKENYYRNQIGKLFKLVIE